MASVVGRVRECPILGIKYILLGHNTIRGAAGAIDPERRAPESRRTST